MTKWKKGSKARRIYIDPKVEVEYESPNVSLWIVQQIQFQLKRDENLR